MRNPPRLINQAVGFHPEMHRLVVAQHWVGAGGRHRLIISVNVGEFYSGMVGDGEFIAAQFAEHAASIHQFALDSDPATAEQRAHTIAAWMNRGADPLVCMACNGTLYLGGRLCRDCHRAPRRVAAGVMFGSGRAPVLWQVPTQFHPVS